MSSLFRHFVACATLSGIFVVMAVAGYAAPFSSASHVKASLVALDEGVQPGKPVTVALKLEHETHWHTYWINAGTGYPTSIKWDLPTGWQAGEIQWPVPMVIKDLLGNVTGNGYEGVVYLPVTLTAPAGLAAGSQVTLKGKADWLMCADVCVPGNADVSLTLPVSTGSQPKMTALRTSVLASPPMPEKPEGHVIRASRGAGAKTITLTVGATDVSEVHFFSNDGFVQYDQLQKVSPSGNGALGLDLPVSDSYDGDGKRLVGVLAFKDAKGIYRGYEVDVVLNDTTGGASQAVGSSGVGISAGVLFFAFVGGLILNLMPCVFPVLGIKILGFVNQAGASRRKVTLHGIAFAVGVIVSFWVLAGILAVLRAGGDQLGWGFQLQSPIFVFVLAAVMLVFAMSMSGVFDFGLSATSVGSSLQSKTGYTGSFFTGVLATVVATPCSAPFLAPALGAALAMSTVESFMVFTAIAVGLAAPYLLLSIFPGAVRVLPRPGAWMETFKQVMAFPLYATVGYLVWVLAGQKNENSLFTTLALVLIALAVWIYGRYAGIGNTPKRRTFGIIASVAVVAFSVWFGWPKSADWEVWSPAAVEKARADGRIVYVDFTARWCATCQVNKKAVFSSEEVNAAFRDKKIVKLKADWTDRNDQIAAELARYRRSAVPFNLIYKPGQAEPVLLPELLTPGIVLDALK